jgi:hypothetical protein
MKLGHVRATLTPVAVRTIAKNDPKLLPDISEESIRDKSKANGFSKFLVCVQTIWFIIKTVSRLATELPISPLEMNTFLHALSCLFMYLAWWHKPLVIIYHQTIKKHPNSLIQCRHTHLHIPP